MKKDINNIALVGRISSSDIEAVYVGEKIDKNIKATFSIALSDDYKKGNGEEVEHTDFFDLEVWGTTAKFVKDYLKKGSQIAVTGRLKQSRWFDETLKKNRSRVYVKVEQLNSLDKKENSTNDSQEQGGSKQYNSASS